MAGKAGLFNPKTVMQLPLCRQGRQHLNEINDDCDKTKTAREIILYPRCLNIQTTLLIAVFKTDQQFIGSFFHVGSAILDRHFAAEH